MIIWIFSQDMLCTFQWSDGQTIIFFSSAKDSLTGRRFTRYLILKSIYASRSLQMLHTLKCVLLKYKRVTVSSVVNPLTIDCLKRHAMFSRVGGNPNRAQRRRNAIPRAPWGVQMLTRRMKTELNGEKVELSLISFVEEALRYPEAEPSRSASGLQLFSLRLLYVRVLSISIGVV